MAIRTVLALFLILATTGRLSGIIYTSPCDMSDRYGSCPPDSCCCRDEFDSAHVYCKPISAEGGPCYAAARDWAGSCNCPANLTCVPNLQVPTWTSKYGTCKHV